jgi:hypothetical protein
VPFVKFVVSPPSKTSLTLKDHARSGLF